MASSINADNGVVSGSSGLKSTADTSGVLALQSNGSTGVTLNTDLSVTFAGAQTLSAGTANGVTYLNGSKVLTSGSTLSTDGTNLALGGSATAFGSNVSTLLLKGTGATTTKVGAVYFKDASSADAGAIFLQDDATYGFTSWNAMATGNFFRWAIGALGTETMRLTSTGLGVGISSLNATLHVQGTATTDGSSIFNQQLNSTTAYNSSPASGTMVALKYTSGGSYAGMGGWSINKENATDGNYSSYFAMHTRANGGAITERFRIASSGQLGIGGANYGTSGQVLTSAGSGAAPTWSDAPAPAAGKLLASGNVTTSSGVTLSWATTGIKRIQVFAAISASSNFDAYMQVGNTTSVISTSNYTVSRMAIQSTTISGNSSGSSGLWQLTSTVASPPSVLQAEIALNSNGNPVMKCEIQQNDSTYGLYKAAGFFNGNWTQFQSVRVWWDGGNGGRVTVVGFTE